MCVCFISAFEHKCFLAQPVTTFERGPHCILSEIRNWDVDGYFMDKIVPNVFASINSSCHEDMTDNGRGVCNKGCYEWTIKDFSRPFTGLASNKA